MEIYTIGFTQSTAEHFFGRLKTAGVRRLLDVRLNTKSQLAGFAKGVDLAYFLSEICATRYEHEALLAPTAEMLKAYRDKEIDWDTYSTGFLALIGEREVESVLDMDSFEQPTALLCSEATADKCHRRLVAEYLADHWKGVTVTHL